MAGRRVSIDTTNNNILIPHFFSLDDELKHHLEDDQLQVISLWPSYLMLSLTYIHHLIATR